MQNLNDDNVVIYAIKAYEKPNCIMSEFEEDFARFKYVKRLLQKYRTKIELRERLILNHLVILINTFGVEPAVRILFLRTDELDYTTLKTFLLYLGCLPKVVYGIDGKDIRTSLIAVDMYVASVLREI